MPDTTTTIPRRNDAMRWTPAETSIHHAIQAVENAGIHPLLDEAVVLLTQAKDKVADFVDLQARPAYQQRVIDEKTELDTKIAALETFTVSNPIFHRLPAEEKGRLNAQLCHMRHYSTILGERIAAF